MVNDNVNKQNAVNFNWGSLIATVAPTVGTVVGQLFGCKNIEDGVVYYKFPSEPGDQANDDFGASFAFDNGGYWLCNQSVKSNDCVTLSFPAIEPNLGCESIRLKGMEKYDVTGMFSRNAAADNSYFELTGDRNARTVENAGANAQFTCSAYRIPTGDNKYHGIGTYIEAKVNNTSLTVNGKMGTIINAINMLTIRTSGDSEHKIMNINGNTGPIVINLPEPLAAGDIVDIGIAANISQEAGFVDNENCTVCSIEEFRRFKNAKRLNWE